ncbi:MAG: leucyl/phenylalanyl-tRNA--protein transferase [Prevotella sp.]|nr:leucyl/phenylalanyl-tRNA--protein transferase [Prevotella sp.]MBR6187788.1 leucyl/phenylalanyl-tRNA--protein transferase [Prevotella sp.]
MAVWQLDNELWFPNPRWGEDDGLVAIGGDLSVKRLLLAYSNGFFPWYAFKMESEPHWYCPLNRFVIFPNEIHISHSMRQLLRQHKYEITVNQNFEGVINGCSTVQSRNEENAAWLGPDIIEAFTDLHRRGYAASVEVWEPSDDVQGRRLVGGLYGVTLRKAFFGESMFSLVPSASKLALVYLAKALENIGGHFIDCQFETPFFKSMGGRFITYDEYMKILNKGE